MSEQQNQQSHMQTYGYIYSIGFFGGVFASGAAYMAHVLNFIPFGPAILFQIWPLYDVLQWLRQFPGHVLAILTMGLISIPVALVYYLLFRHMQSPWFGIWFGGALWVIIFLGLNQIIPGVQTIGQLGWTTNIVLVCIFVVYGLFTGYSISYEANIDHNEGKS